jgi:hypothetical protein
MESTTLAPLTKPYRKGVAANDTLPVTDERLGLNCGNYESVHINVLPSGGANPNVAVLYWSPQAGAFIAENPALTRAGIGADTPYTFTVLPKGRAIFVAVTGGLGGGKVDIETSAYGIEVTM